MSKIRTIRLYGKLGAKFGREFKLHVNSAAEAIRALSAQLPGFDAYLSGSKDRGEGYAVFYGKKNLTVDELRDIPGNGDIRIAPMMLGAKKQGMTSIIVGVVLVVIGAVLTVYGFGIGIPIMKIGASMIIGGVVQMLTPVPKAPNPGDGPNNKPSYNFNGPINTQAQGNPVQVMYGEGFIGSAVLSAGITSVDMAYIPNGEQGGGALTWVGGWKKLVGLE
jgi:predicted phage tail protein